MSIRERNKSSKAIISFRAKAMYTFPRYQVLFNIVAFKVKFTLLFAIHYIDLTGSCSLISSFVFYTIGYTIYPGNIDINIR